MKTYLKNGVTYIDHPPTQRMAILMKQYKDSFDVQMRDMEILNELELRFQNARQAQTKKTTWKLIIHTREMIEKRCQTIQKLDQVIFEVFQGQYNEREIA